MSRYARKVSTKVSAEQYKYLVSLETETIADALRLCVEFSMETEKQATLIRRALDDQFSKIKQENQRLMESFSDSIMSDSLENTKRLSQNLTSLTAANQELASSVGDLPRQVGQMVKNIMEIVFPERVKRKSAANAPAKKAAV